MVDNRGVGQRRTEGVKGRMRMRFDGDEGAAMLTLP